MDLRCKNKKCGKKIIVKDGSFDKERRIVCKCGEQNVVSKKKNGRVMVS